MADDDEQFDNIDPRLSPSIPQLDDNFNEIWPEGIPRQAKDDYKEYESKAKQSTTSVKELDEWYCEKIKLSDIHNKQLAHMIAKKKKNRRNFSLNSLTQS